MTSSRYAGELFRETDTSASPSELIMLAPRIHETMLAGAQARPACGAGARTESPPVEAQAPTMHLPCRAAKLEELQLRGIIYCLHKPCTPAQAESLTTFRFLRRRSAAA